MSDIKKLCIRVGDDPGAPPMTLAGREAWAMGQLLKAGDGGCTPLTHPGPRWSDYTFKLRRRGLVIETVTEMHGGTYAGHHARYVLRSRVTIISAEAA